MSSLSWPTVAPALNVSFPKSSINGGGAVPGPPACWDTGGSTTLAGRLSEQHSPF